MSKPGPGDSFFVGIGAQKAATSWLADYLDGHPQVGFSPIKELHYFDAVYCPKFCGNYHRDMRKRLAKLASDIPSKPSDKWYRKLNTYGLRVRMMEKPEVYRDYFERLRSPGHRTVGEITPSYSMMDARGFAAIKAMMPAAKFIFILRDPLTRYLSQVRFRESQLPESGFRASEEVLQHIYDRQYDLRTDYGRTLDELEQVAPGSDICVVFYEHLMSPQDDGAELRRITDFLDIDYRPGDVGTRVNAGMPVAFDKSEHRRIVQRFARVYEYIFQRYGGRVPASWRSSYELLGGERSAFNRFYEDRFKGTLIPWINIGAGRVRRLLG